jgi:LuxR family transcriptional regulator, maltose regulon positive regulatory protein
MDAPLLATKLFVPSPRPDLVPRSRLVERLDSGIAGTLTLVSAPAGFGKTTAVAQWVALRSAVQPVAWVQLDEGDNDPVRFWDYVIAALQKSRPGVGQTGSTMLHSAQPYPLESSITALINDLALDRPDLVLVLDDYHLIKTEAIHKGIAFLIQHAPPGLHLVISTRSEPDLPLPLLRGRGLVSEVRTDDLRFTADEATDLLRGLLGAAISTEHANTLNAHAEGWVVGLKMVALSLRGQPGAERLVASFAGSSRYVMDYLVEEVLRQQPAAVRAFLLKTSVLERLCGPLCDELVGNEGSEDTLKQLESANLFLVPLDETGQWYRYHHLFADLLRHQLQVTGGADEVNRLQRSASTWFEENGQPGDAIRHSLAAKDWHKAMSLIEAQYEATVKRGEWDTLFGWFQTIPDELLRSDLRLYSHYANVLITRGSLQTAEAVLVYLESVPNVDESLRGELNFFRMEVAYRRGDLKRMAELGERAVEQLTEEKGAMRARALHMLAVLEWSAGRLDGAQSREAEVIRISRRFGESWVGGTAAGSLSLILWLRGKLSDALQSGEQAVELAGQSPGAQWPHCMIGTVLYERNELEEAERRSRLAVKWVELGGYAESPAYYCLARDLLAKGYEAEADREIAKGDEASRHPTAGPLFRAWHAANRVMYSVQRDDLTVAESWGRRLAQVPGDATWMLTGHAPARLLIARGEMGAAAEQLRSLYERAITADAMGYAIRLLVFQALAAASQEQALGFLAEALRNGEPEGFVRTFVDEGKLLRPLLIRAVTEGITTPYASRLIGIIDAEQAGRQARTPNEPNPGLLSEREFEVLRLIAAGLSNRQIAGRLVITLNTAKTHVRNISQKLEVSTRTQILARAKEFNLI